VEVGEPLQARHWIFDLDGTLTRAVHDFDGIRTSLGLPQGKPILESLDQLPKEEAAPKRQWLDAMELELAQASTPQAGIVEHLQALHAAGTRLGILTRNSKRNALASIEALGVAALFDEAHVLGRDEAAFKPDPAGLHHLLAAWDARPEDALFAGDGRFDLEAGRRAGIRTLYFDPSGAFPHSALADMCLSCWTQQPFVQA
jgi:HAD superfamily hydrolase (TIGR01509 family)